MKKFRKLLSLVLTVIMVFAMAAPSFAAETRYSLTINNAGEYHIYQAYQIFSGTISGTEGNYVLADVEWGTGVDSSDLLTELKEKTWRYDDTIISFKDCITAENVADVLADNNSNASFAKDLADVIGKYLSETAGTGSYDEDENEYVISELSAGYYLIKDIPQKNEDGEIIPVESYSDFIMEVVGDAEASRKADSVPTPGKEIGDEPKEDKVTSGDYSIGDKIPYVLTAKLPESSTFDEYTSYYLKFEDTLSNGLSYVKDSVKVYLNSVSDDNLLSINDDYTLNDNYEDGKTLTVTFSNVKDVTGVKAGDTIIVTYKAVLNENAVIGEGNDNTLKLEYSNNPNDNQHGITGGDKVKVYTYALDIYKYALDDNTQSPLKDAEFVLYRQTEDNEKEYAIIENEKITGWSEPTSGTEIPTGVSSVKSKDDGKILIAGLDEGTYFLLETSAPAGYNKLTDPIEFTITAEISENSINGLTIQVEDDPAEPGIKNESDGKFTGHVEIEVENKSGATLPSTGGIGTTIFYAAGIVLMAGAVFFVVRRKRA